MSLNVVSFGALGKMYMKEAITGKAGHVLDHLFAGLDVDLGFASRGVSLGQLLLEHGIKEFFVGSVFRCSEGCLEVPFVSRWYLVHALDALWVLVGILVINEPAC